MKQVLTNAQMRKCDENTIQNAGVPSELLMERAGRAIAEEVKAAVKARGAKSVLVVCGSGNNGGDGYVCARTLLAEGLKESGVFLSVYACGSHYSADCEREKAKYTGSYATKIAGDILVDCLFGTGLSRKVTGEYATAIAQMNASGAYILSADIPSGLNGDNGCVMGIAVKANLTVAIAALKAGMFLNDGRALCGRVVVKDIGIPLLNEAYTQLYEEEDVASFFPARKQNSHKGTFGTVNLAVGSKRYAGAAVLCTTAALRSGCGYVRLTATNKLIRQAVLGCAPQTILQPHLSTDAQAMVVGCGRGCTRALYRQIKFLLLNYTGKLILDADGLNALAKYGVSILQNKKCDVLITPHLKEFARLSGLAVADIVQNPVEYAKQFAAKYQVTVLLKSAVSVITDGTQTVINITGNSALAKAGSGDMLAGLIGGTAARGLSLLNSAVCGAYLLGKAAERTAEQTSEYAATATEIVQNMAAAICQLTNRRETGYDSL